MFINKLEEKQLVKINLQLFADVEDEEDIDDGDLNPEEDDIEDNKDQGQDDDHGEDDEDAKSDYPEDEEDSEEEEDSDKKTDDKKPLKDKKTAAIIRAKQENKKLRDELAKYKQAEEERRLAAEKEKIKQKYIDNGFTEEEALERAEEKTRISKLENELKQIKYLSQADKLASRYPDIYDHLDRLIEISEKIGWSLEKVCRAELHESSEFDIRTKTEQAVLIAKQKQAKSKPVAANSTKMQSIKLDPEDERAYQVYLRFNPGVSRKQYKERVLDAVKQKIPHGRWED